MGIVTSREALDTTIEPNTGMQKTYLALPEEERAKGYVRPVRTTYTHKTCNTSTTMNIALAQTYARQPKFYQGTFCNKCKSHYPVEEFVWQGTEEEVGS